ncbi:hypothetical protein LOK49_LG08G03454 [Camellia lanceoleosa]|uniref:Uncharacterized protein n=1 Tax=Camellia lanceoleosa TaxID=1840588 RepID=A0ACC0GSM7_9ERIC|nr:hypothetical protein LOK49_LG08G03454 [Camellia lanceoleosa]
MKACFPSLVAALDLFEKVQNKKKWRATTKKEEPNTTPQPDRWFNLTLGSSFKDHYPSSKFCTLRYEFKPSSIDKNQTGLLHKNKENRVTVEFHNNQPGKPQVTFEGSSEDYKENDAVLFFDAVKRLRHVRLPGESAAAAVGTSHGAAVEAISPPTSKVAKVQTLNKSIPHLMPVKSMLDPCEDENDDIQDDDVSLGADFVQRDEHSESISEVRIAQGLVHLGKGLLTLAPYHSERFLLSP